MRFEWAQDGSQEQVLVIVNVLANTQMYCYTDIHFSSVGNYERAVQKLRMCEETSDLNTDLEESCHKRRYVSFSDY